MREIFDALNSLGGKLSIGGGTLLAGIFGIFKFNSGLDNRIDKRSRSQVEKAMTEKIPGLIEEGIEKSAKLATLEAGVGSIKETVDQILSIHLNGKGK